MSGRCWLYLQSERGSHPIWTVGFYDPTDQWIAESDHDTPEKAAARVHYLNGGTSPAPEPSHV